MDVRTHSGSPLYLLERSEVGLVQLDRDLRVSAMNSFARRVLPVEEKQPFEKMVLSFHPERSQSKVTFLIDRDDGRVTLKLRHEDAALPVARTSVPKLLQRLRLSEA